MIETYGASNLTSPSQSVWTSKLEYLNFGCLKPLKKYQMRLNHFNLIPSLFFIL